MKPPSPLQTAVLLLILLLVPSLPAEDTGNAGNGADEQFIADARKAKRADKSPEARKRMDWWRDARFGMFIHWDPSSVVCGEISWSKQFYNDDGENERKNPRPAMGGIPEHEEWLSWFRPAVPKEVYENLPKSFYPGMFDADQIVATAKKAGMQYIVMVSKHHNGFCMWDTKLTDHNVMNTPFHRDIVGEMAEACDRAGMPFGIYYSQRDWHHPDYTRDRICKYNEYMRNQIRELMEKHPNIRIVWFDSRPGYSFELWEGEKLFSMIRSLRPDVIINDRCGLPGDFRTVEQKIGAYEPDTDWESCMTFTGFWSWHGFQTKVVPFSDCIRMLVSCAGGGGNLLFNIDPMPTGQIDPREVDRLQRTGEWLAKYGESIYGTTAGPIRPGDYGVSTAKGNKVYVHILNWPKDGILFLPPIGGRVLSSAEVLGGSSVGFKQNKKGITLKLEPAQRLEIDTIVVLELKTVADSSGKADKH
jgi:alpha-L-fucosidase